jgi:hydrogenase expression/formation protein HypD
MEFCGGHTHAISRYGVCDLLPANVRMIHGPGCPVCVLPIGRIDMAIRLALEAGVTLCSYGDPMRVPASAGLSLLKAKAKLGRGAGSVGTAGSAAGGDIRMVYSCADAAGAGAAGIPSGRWSSSPSASKPRRRRPRAHQAGAGARPAQLLGALLPRADAVGDRQHSRIAGSPPWGTRAARRLHRSGARVDDHRHAPLRVLCRGVPQAGGHRRLRAARRDAGDPDADQAGQCRPALVENEFSRAVDRDGNRKAQHWSPKSSNCGARSPGAASASCPIARCAFAGVRRIRRRAPLRGRLQAVEDHPACECGAILRGVKRPQDCRIVRQRVHAGKPGRLVHGVIGRRLRRALLLGRLMLRAVP